MIPYGASSDRLLLIFTPRAWLDWHHAYIPHTAAVVSNSAPSRSLRRVEVLSLGTFCLYSFIDNDKVVFWIGFRVVVARPKDIIIFTLLCPNYLNAF
jgi:hypothetical protein